MSDLDGTDDFEPTPLIPGAHYMPDPWEGRVDSQLRSLRVEVHLTAAGTILLLLTTMVFGRTIVRLVKTQAEIVEILRNAGVVASEPTTEPATPPPAKTASATDVTPGSAAATTGVRYATPEKHVDTTGSSVDPALLAELSGIVATDPLRAGDDGGTVG